MAERSRFWDGTTTGDATVAPYDAPTEFAQVQMALTGAVTMTNKGGVWLGALSDLAPSVSGANTLRVASGNAQVYGTWYENDGNVDTTVPTPSVSTRIDRIVLRKSWASQTVRVTRIAGVEGGSAPALVQTLGTTWDVPICQVSITTGAVMTVTDQREGMLVGRRSRGFLLPLYLKNTVTPPETDGTFGIAVHKLANAASDLAQGHAPLPQDYIATGSVIVKIRFWSTVTSDNVRIQLNCGYLRVGAVPNQLAFLNAAQFTVAVPAVANQLVEYEFGVSPLPLAGDWLTLQVMRLGADALDTNTGVMHLASSVEIEYQADS